MDHLDACDRESDTAAAVCQVSTVPTALRYRRTRNSLGNLKSISAEYDTTNQACGCKQGYIAHYEANNELKSCGMREIAREEEI